MTVSLKTAALQSSKARCIFMIFCTTIIPPFGSLPLKIKVLFVMSTCADLERLVLQADREEWISYVRAGDNLIPSQRPRCLYQITDQKYELSLFYPALCEGTPGYSNHNSTEICFAVTPGELLRTQASHTSWHIPIYPQTNNTSPASLQWEGLMLVIEMFCSALCLLASLMIRWKWATLWGGSISTQQQLCQKKSILFFY